MEDDEENDKGTPSDWKAQLDAIINTDGQRNNFCADCFVNASDSNWGVWNHGIFVCIKCAGVHRQIGVHISKVKSTEFDKWRRFELKHVQPIGNVTANKTLERRKPCWFINPSECDGVEEVRKYYIQQKYEFKLFETDGKDDVAIHEMPQKVRIGTFLYENNKKKVYLQLLGRTLYHLKSGNDSYPQQTFDVANDIEVAIAYSDSVYTDFVLNIYSDNDSDSLFRIRPIEQNNALYLMEWVHAIRRAKLYYKYLDSHNEQKTSNEPNTPFTEITIKQLERATVLAIASKKGGGANAWRKRWWILLNDILYYFKDDFRRNKKAKGIGIPQGHIALSKADIIWDYDRTRTGKQHAFMICTPHRTFYVQPQRQNKDVFFRSCSACCTKYANPK
eukprot:315149_1